MHPDCPESCVLVVEDDLAIREMIVAQLKVEAYHLLSAKDIAEARSVLDRCAIDLIVLDLNLPDGSGLDFCRALRAGGFGGAIIMVTARDAPIDRVLGLEYGADDYLTKPFEPRELLLRVRNLLRRSRDVETPGTRSARIARFGGWRLDLHYRCLVTADDRLVMLSAAEYRLLCRFLQSPNQVLSREELSPERSATVAFDRTIDVQVSRLRHKLASEGDGEPMILTVRREGYVLPGSVVFE